MQFVIKNKFHPSNFQNLQHTLVVNSLINIENWTSTLVNVEKCEQNSNFQH